MTSMWLISVPDGGVGIPKTTIPCPAMSCSIPGDSQIKVMVLVDISIEMRTAGGDGDLAQ